MAQIFCKRCSTMLSPSDSKCPNCESKGYESYDRFINVSPTFPLSKLSFYLVDKDLHPGKLYETYIKPSFDRDTQQDTIVIRFFNRRKECISLEGSYIEEVWTRDNKLLKKTVGKLIDHIGHGSDKKNRKKCLPIMPTPMSSFSSTSTP